jgi:hypothetical protein
VIFWYHNGTLLKDGKYPEMGVGVGGGPGGGSGLISSHLTLTPSRTMSMLTIHEIQHIHSGNYTCRAPNAEPDTTQLFVTQRKYIYSTKSRLTIELYYIYVYTSSTQLESCFSSLSLIERKKKGEKERTCYNFRSLLYNLGSLSPS